MSYRNRADDFAECCADARAVVGADVGAGFDANSRADAHATGFTDRNVVIYADGCAEKMVQMQIDLQNPVQK